MEVRLKDTGSMVKLVVLECSEHLLTKYSKAFGNRTEPLICVYSDKIMVRICLEIRQQMA